MPADIQLQEMPSVAVDLQSYDVLPPSYATGLEVPEPYDPSFRWSILSSAGTIDVLVSGLCGKAVASPGDIQQISLIVPTTGQRTGTYSRPSQPTLVEHGGTNFHVQPQPWRGDDAPTPTGTGTCLLVGDHEGYYVPGEDVVRVLQGTRPNGQHAIVKISVGTVFAVGQRLINGDRTIAVYQIDDLMPAPKWFYDKIKEYKAANHSDPRRKIKTSAEAPMAVNASLISLRLISASGTLGWSRPEEESNGRHVDASFIIDGVLRKLGGNSTGPSFVEMIYSISAPRKKGAFQIAHGQGTTTIETNVASFIPTLLGEIASYRKLLLDAQEDNGKKALPMTSELSYLPNSNDVQVVVTLPRQLSEANPTTMTALQIVTVIPGGDIPEDFMPYCSLLNNARTEVDLHDRVMGDLGPDQGVMIYLLTHVK